MKAFYWIILFTLFCTGYFLLRGGDLWPDDYDKALHPLYMDITYGDTHTWYEHLEHSETPRLKLREPGAGLITLSLTLAILQLFSGFPLPGAKSPRSIRSFNTYYIAALIIQPVSIIWYYGHRMATRTYPQWGDSMGIPILGGIMTCGFALVFVAAWSQMLATAPLPVKIYNWPKNNLIKNIFYTFILLVFIFLFLFIIIHGITYGGIGSIIFFTVLIYLFSSIRAATLEPQIKRKVENIKDLFNGNPPEHFVIPKRLRRPKTQDNTRQK